MKFVSLVLLGLVALATATNLGRHLTVADDDSKWVFPMGNFTHYSQCDHKWGTHYMGNKTICEVGCFMSSVSSAVHDHGIKFQVKPFGEMPVTSNPGTLNQWLRENNGYEVNLFKSDEVYKLCLHFPERPCLAEYAVLHDTNALTPEIVHDLLSNYVTLLANVHDGQHFVRIVGYHKDFPDAVYAMDPGFHRVIYSLKHDIVGWRVFAFESSYSPAERPGGADMKATVEQLLGDNFKEWARPAPEPAPEPAAPDATTVDVIALAASVGL
jgi:hypothetical protein